MDGVHVLGDSHDATVEMGELGTPSGEAFLHTPCRNTHVHMADYMMQNQKISLSI